MYILYTYNIFCNLKTSYSIRKKKHAKLIIVKNKLYIKTKFNYENNFLY